MKHHRIPQTPRIRPPNKLIRTNIFDVIGAFIDAAKSDAEVIASLQQLFVRSRVQLLRSPAPVRVVISTTSSRRPVKGKFAEAGCRWKQGPAR